MPESSRPKGSGLKVIHASLFRMGTMSIATAYAELGYKVHHGLISTWSDAKWKRYEEAIEATFPDVQTGTTRPPFTRADWDDLWGLEYDIVTDAASAVVPELIKAYPEAKVVVVKRDFDSWWKSLTNLTGDINKPVFVAINYVMSLFQGYSPGTTASKLLRGFFGIKSLKDLDETRGRQTYDEYFKRIRELVPPERRLEYKISDGWEPLCSFLGAEVPDMPFPRRNETVATHSFWESTYGIFVGKILTGTFGMTLMRVLAGGVSAWMAYRWLLG